MTPVEKLQLKNMVMRVLHAPCGPLSGLTSGRQGAYERKEALTGTEATAAVSGIGRRRGCAGLEMTIVFDCGLKLSDVRAAGAEITAVLKSTDEIFRNVRLLAVRWISDTQIRYEVTALPVVQTGRYFDNYEQIRAEKHLETLTGSLKKFAARSRLILVVTGGHVLTADTETLRENLNPFLYRRLILLTPDGMMEGKTLLQLK